MRHLRSLSLLALAFALQACPSGTTAPDAVPPGPPTLLSAGAAQGGANLIWSAPAEAGSSAVTSYRVHLDPPVPGSNVAISETNAVVTGLTGRTTYTASISAVNAAGEGTRSNTLTFQPLDVPTAAASLTATAGVRSVTLSWSPPEDDGGEPLIDYVVRVSQAETALPPRIVSADMTAVRVDGLADGLAYGFVVVAVNALGESPPSMPIVATTFAVPGPPTAVSATPGTGRATVTWTAPASDGGSPLLGYVVRATPGGATAGVDASTSEALVSGLRAGVSYTFTVEARNEVGAGPKSAPSAGVTVPDVAACTETLVLHHRPAVTALENLASPVVVDLDGDGKKDLAYGMKTSGLGARLSDGAGQFGAQIVTVVGQEVTHLTSADLNGDGKADLLAATSGNNLRVLLGQGDGTFTLGIEYPLSGAVQLVTGDFNGDGKADLAAAIRYSDRVVIRYGNGDGTLLAAQSITVGQQPASLAVGRLDANTRDDLVVGEALVDTLSILRVNDTGTWVRTTRNSAAVRDGVALGDFNGDGRLDLVGTEYFDRELSISLGNGDGTFQSGFRYDVTDAAVRDVVALDANGDGKLDAALVDTSQRQIVTFLGDGMGGFTTVLRAHSGMGDVASRLTAADFDADGRPELVTLSNDLRSVLFLEASAGGEFGATGNVVIGAGTATVHAGDLNGDGFGDVVATASEARRVLTYLGRSSGEPRAPLTTTVSENIEAAAVGDFNGDGRLDVAVAGPTKLQMLTGRGDGRFDLQTAVALERPAGRLFANDIDRDGISDLVVVERLGTGLQIFQGTREGTFKKGNRYPWSQYIRGAAVGDFNKDGRMDVAIANDTDKHAIYLGTASGTFATGPSFTFTGDANSVGVGDVDGDGDDDFLVGFSDQRFVRLYRNNGTGTFAAGETVALAGFSQAMIVRDLEHDGVPEVLLAVNGTLEVLQIDSGIRRRYPLARGTTQLVTVDVQGDGREDLVFATDFSGTTYPQKLGQLINRCEP